MTENRSGGAVGPGAEPQSPSPSEPRPPSEPQSQSEPQPWPRHRPPTLDEVLAAASRPEPVAPRGAEDAVAAFRAARDEGGLGLPTRPGDDWRPAERWTRRPWIKTGLGTFAAGVMLGGVAMASGAIPAPFGAPPAERPGPAAGTSTPSGSGDGTPAATETRTPQATTGAAGLPATTPDAARPATAQDRAAHCRAYEAAEEAASAAEGAGKGRAPDSAVRERLEAAAGGPDAVEAYCAQVSEDGMPGSSDQRPTSTPDRNTAAAVPPGAGAARGGQGEGRDPARKPARQ
ncbi:hypothetical protein [Streptomyces sp. NPDC006274]|uniref:hypothetical protein n=1 Tax=unclassified Streptomyces TaxID=2593676 RepID=UPI00339F1560